MGFIKIIADFRFISTLYFMVDVIPYLTKVAKYFRKQIFTSAVQDQPLATVNQLKKPRQGKVIT